LEYGKTCHGQRIFESIMNADYAPYLRGNDGYINDISGIPASIITWLRLIETPRGYCKYLRVKISKLSRSVNDVLTLI